MMNFDAFVEISELVLDLDFLIVDFGSFFLLICVEDTVMVNGF